MDPLSNENELLINGIGDVGHSSGGRSGAEFAARRLSTHPHECAAEFAAPLEYVLALTTKLMLRDAIAVVPSEDDWDPNAEDAAVLVGSGWLNMNPAVLQCRVTGIGARTRVEVRANAKEGLIKQGTARKAVTRLLAELRAELSPEPSS